MLGVAAIVVFAALARHVESFWQRIKQGLAIFREPGRYLREVAAWQLVGWLCRFASFWFFLDAFHVGGSFQNVLLVMSVQSITGALPFTPGGAGAQQALLVATLHGAPRTLVLAYSVGQQIAITAWSVAVAFRFGAVLPSAARGAERGRGRGRSRTSGIDPPRPVREGASRIVPRGGGRALRLGRGGRSDRGRKRWRRGGVCHRGAAGERPGSPRQCWRGCPCRGGVH